MKGSTGRPNLKGTVPVTLGAGPAPGQIDLKVAFDKAERGRQLPAFAGPWGAFDTARQAVAAHRTRTAEAVRTFETTFWNLIVEVVRSYDENYVLRQDQRPKCDAWLREKWKGHYEYILRPLNLGAGHDPRDGWVNLCTRGGYLPPRVANANLHDTLWTQLLDNTHPLRIITLMGLAQKLRVTVPKGKAMYFNICSVSDNANNETTTIFAEKVDSRTQEVGVCFETYVLPKPIAANTDLIIHQTKTPCGPCREGYRRWAETRRCVIVVAVTDQAGYDSCAGDGVFVFGKTGRGLHVK